jgi:hypothetical protein
MLDVPNGIASTHVFVTAHRRFQIDQVAYTPIAVRDSSDAAVGKAETVLLLPNGVDVNLEFRNQYSKPNTL